MPEKADRRLELAVVLLVGIGVTARFYGLNINGYWYDELVSLVTGDPARSLRDIVFSTPANEVHPPLYALILSVWRSVVGDGEAAVRALSALLGTATIALAFWGGRRLLSRSALRLFVAFTACSFGGILYAQEARPYALLGLLAMGLTLLTYRGLREMDAGTRVSTSTLLGLGMTGVLASYTHYFGLLYAGGAYAALLYQAVLRRRSPGRVVAYGLGTLLFAAAWLAYDLPRKTGLSGDNFWPGTSVRWILRQAEIWTTYVLGPAALLLGAMAVARLFYVSRSTDGSSRLALILSPPLGILVSVVITCGLALLVSIHSSVLVARYFLVLAPGVYLVLALAFETTPSGPFASSRLREALGLACAALMLAPVIAMYRPYKQQYREAAGYIVNDPQCTDASVLFWRPPGWVTSGLDEARFYIPDDSQIRLTSTDSVANGVIEQQGRECPVLAWVIYNGGDANQPKAVIRSLGLAPDSIDVVVFRGTYLLRRK